MRSAHLAVAAALLATAGGLGCGDDGGEIVLDGGLPADFLEKLQKLPGVHDAEQVPTQTDGYYYFVVHFEQPVDHDDPQGPTFLQKVSLLHKDLEAPMVEWTSGYWDYYNDRVVEPTQLLGANQVSIEHRYFDTSRPTDPDWSKLTIASMAHDQHRITTALKELYSGAFVTSGASKGGMTAIYYRRFYPDDVDGTLPYVAPISFGAPDARYNGFLDTLGPQACRQAVRDVAVAMLANHRDAFVTRATAAATMRGDTYTRIPIGPAVESSIVSLEWSFWQYYGVGYCDEVPAPTAVEADLWQFLDDISPVSDNSDKRIAQFDAYYYQAYHQLGYPEGGAAYLDPYLVYTDADYLGALPAPQPAYDGGTAMMDIDQWLRAEGDRFAFIYGQWDPWTGGQFDLGGATDSLRVEQAEGTHAARITKLSTEDMSAVFDKLEAWTGVRPALPSSGRLRSTMDVAPAPIRVPPALGRLFTRRRSP